MSLTLVALPIVPDDTASKALNLYGKGNLFIQLGEQINELLTSLFPTNMEIPDRRSAETDTRLTLMSVLQYSEQLTDSQILESVRRRVDLRYALHLPMDYPHFDPHMLCSYRVQLFENPQDLDTFQALLDRLVEGGFLNNCQGPQVSVTQVLETICTSTRIEKVLESMHRALESLAASKGDWLRMIALPLWYERYSRSRKLPVWANGKGEWKVRAVDLGKDIHYLLEQIHRSDQPGIESLREVQNLGKIWDEQFEMVSDDLTPARSIHWRLKGCASCSIN